MIIRDALADFGDNGTDWFVDHPTTTVLQLKDGLHGVLSYRVRDPHRFKGRAVVKPSLQSGAYIEEIKCSGKPVPIWEF